MPARRQRGGAARRASGRLLRQPRPPKVVAATAQYYCPPLGRSHLPLTRHILPGSIRYVADPANADSNRRTVFRIIVDGSIASLRSPIADSKSGQPRRRGQQRPQQQLIWARRLDPIQPSPDPRQRTALACRDAVARPRPIRLASQHPRPSKEPRAVRPLLCKLVPGYSQHIRRPQPHAGPMGARPS